MLYFVMLGLIFGLLLRPFHICVVEFCSKNVTSEKHLGEYSSFFKLIMRIKVEQTFTSTFIVLSRV